VDLGPALKRIVFPGEKRCAMAEPLDPKDLVTVEDLAVSSLWEIAALVEVLEKKGVLTRQELYDAITERRKRQLSKRSNYSAINMIQKHPGIAAVLSFFITGFGQIYNGEIGKGIICKLAYFICWGLTAILIGCVFLLPLWV
jgi:TM2 domain-containing membrane protein YozV